jgi:hypothetical protein
MTIDDRMDDLIDLWHEGDGQGMSLHEWLGLTWDQFARWAEDPSDLPEGYEPPAR